MGKKAVKMPPGGRKLLFSDIFQHDHVFIPESHLHSINEVSFTWYLVLYNRYFKILIFK